MSNIDIDESKSLPAARHEAWHHQPMCYVVITTAKVLEQAIADVTNLPDADHEDWLKGIDGDPTSDLSCNRHAAGGAGGEDELR